MEYILSLSYGKDSLACFGACEILGWPIDRVVTAEVWATDTLPADLPPMVEFKDHADRIRAMTDEELAGIFLRADFCKCCEHEKGGVCNFICAYPNIPIYEGCRQAALKWMKQPVEVDT